MNIPAKFEKFTVLTFLLLALCAVSFHIFVFGAAFHFNEDIWARYGYTFSDFWRRATVSYCSPTYYLILVLTSYFPIWGAFSHGPSIVLFLTSIALLYRGLKVVLGTDTSSALFGISIFAATPSITEGTVWVAGSHPSVGVFWFLVLLNVIPRTPTYYWKRWVVASAALIIFLTSTALAYASFALLFLAFAWYARKNKNLMLVALGILLLAIAHIFWRNYLLNDDILNFSPNPPNYNPPQARSILWISDRLDELVSLSLPLVIAKQTLTTGYLAPQIIVAYSSTLLILIIPTWLYFWRRFGIPVAAIVLASVGVLVTLLTIPSVVQRYLVFLVLSNSIWLALLYSVVKTKRYLHTASTVTACGIVGLCLYGKVDSELLNWVNPGLMYRNMMEISSEPGSNASPTVFIINDEFHRRFEVSPRHTGGSNPTLAGLRKMLSFSGSTTCIYEGYIDKVSDWQKQNLIEGNSESLLHVYGLTLHVTPLFIWKGWDCPLLPPKSTPSRCYRYNANSYPWGHFERVRDSQAVVAAKFEHASAAEETTLNCN